MLKEEALMQTVSGGAWGNTQSRARVHGVLTKQKQKRISKKLYASKVPRVFFLVPSFLLIFVLMLLLLLLLRVSCSSLSLSLCLAWGPLELIWSARCPTRASRPYSPARDVTAELGQSAVSSSSRARERATRLDPHAEAPRPRETPSRSMRCYL